MLVQGDREVWPGGIAGRSGRMPLRGARAPVGSGPGRGRGRGVWRCCAGPRVWRESGATRSSERGGRRGRLFVRGPLAGIEHELLRVATRSASEVLTQWLRESVTGAWQDEAAGSFPPDLPVPANRPRPRGAASGWDACLHLAGQRAPGTRSGGVSATGLENGAWCGHRRWVLPLAEGVGCRRLGGKVSSAACSRRRGS